MGARRLDIAVTVLLILALAAAALSGLLADYLGIPRSIYHRLSGYALAALASWHIVLRRRQMWARLKAVAGRRGRPAVSAQSGTGRAATPAWLQMPSRRSFLFSGAAAVAGFFAGRWLAPGRLPPELEGADFGLVYHQWSKPSLWSIIRRPFQWGGQPPLYKEYPSAQRVFLPRDFKYRGLSVEEAINRRRSIRDYSGKPLTLEQLSLLLHSAYGITESSGPLRASPSAGALYPLEVYAVVNSVAGLASGVYHYQPRDHSLDLLKEGEFRAALLAYTGGQDMVLQASVVLVITAIFQRTRWKYQDRSYRYVLLDAGHLGENLYLAATSLGVGPCGIGAFLDDEVNRLVGVDGQQESAVYLVSIGTLP
ncbi:MAG: SagB/ThcOx family dehydrogenase [Chloroflexota bacterium]|nr:SagB/ThcOx family dehydrogenase [Chloroflexota bacterium]